MQSPNVLTDAGFHISTRNGNSGASFGVLGKKGDGEYGKKVFQPILFF